MENSQWAIFCQVRYQRIYRGAKFELSTTTTNLYCFSASKYRFALANFKCGYVDRKFCFREFGKQYFSSAYQFDQITNLRELYSENRNKL
uniref:Uncharacterized protein n=1 Tax=Romanomermis culicivorax TaxID=13658 RepID=A0A915KEG6_ROMCU